MRHRHTLLPIATKKKKVKDLFTGMVHLKQTMQEIIGNGYGKVVAVPDNMG